MAHKILNSKGEPIVLNDREAQMAAHQEKMFNALGYEIDITSLTQILKKVSEQKFFKIAPADYVPVVVGEGAWSTNLVTYLSYSLGGGFEEGVLNTGANSSRVASADTGVEPKVLAVKNWAKGIGWSVFDLQHALNAGNWDLVAAKEKARKLNWDLGIQKTAFLGLKGSSDVLGLLNQSGVTVNTTLITAPLSGLTAANFTAFCAAIIEAYRVNSDRTAMPSHFIMPESDYNGMAAPFSDFPIKSKLQVLQEAFAVVTQNPQFKILPCAYADAAYSDSVLSSARYTLLNYEEESVRMNIPVDYTTTMANTLNGLSFENAAYGQFTGVQALRPKEMLYLE